MMVVVVVPAPAAVRVTAAIVAAADSPRPLAATIRVRILAVVCLVLSLKLSLLFTLLPLFFQLVTTIRTCYRSDDSSQTAMPYLMSGERSNRSTNQSGSHALSRIVIVLLLLHPTCRLAPSVGVSTPAPIM